MSIYKSNCPYSAGGSADILARRVANKFPQGVSKAVIVENKSGASGRLAVQYVKQQPANGAFILETAAIAFTLFETLKKNRAAGGMLMKATPKFMQSYQAFNAAQNSNGALDAKTRELIALAVAVTTRCDGCIAAHANGAKDAAVTEAELADALGTPMALNTGAAFVYSNRVMEAYQQFSAC